MYEHDLCGSHAWLNVQKSMLRSSLMHYYSCKRKDPYATSACVLVPASLRGSNREMLKHWTVVKEIPKGAPCIMMQDGKSIPTIATCNLQILYDPVMVEQLAAVKDGRLTMHFVGKAADKEVDFLFDSGASCNFVSAAFARLHGLTVESTKSNVRLGTDTVAVFWQLFSAYSLR